MRASGENYKSPRVRNKRAKSRRDYRFLQRKRRRMLVADAQSRARPIVERLQYIGED